MSSRCYAALFTSHAFTHSIFVDQAPLQNRLPDWQPPFCNRGMNNPTAVAALQDTLATAPATAHRGTIAACLSYRAHPLPTDFASQEERQAVTAADERFFLAEAMKGRQAWYGRLMADHTALDWRASIAATFGPQSGSRTKVLVVASERSGCFPAEGPLFVVGLVGERARGVSVEWGGHWCYVGARSLVPSLGIARSTDLALAQWEDPQKFNELVLGFLSDAAGDSGLGRWVGGIA